MSVLKLIFQLSKSLILFLGELSVTFIQIIKTILRGKINYPEFISESKYFLYSLFIPTSIIAISLGIVMSIQLGPEFISRGIGNKLGIVSMLTMTRELIPVVGSLMIATQYGTGIAAQFGNMKITEQIDALTVMRVDPIYYLVVPRFLAAILFAPVLIWIASLLSVISSFVTVLLSANLSMKAFTASILAYYKLSDINLCLMKASIFGGLIILIASTLGLNTKGGAKEVGQATTKTVIVSFIAIVLVDYIITSIYL